MPVSIHLPVSNLAVSTAFYDGLGFARQAHRSTPDTGTWLLEPGLHLVVHTITDFSYLLRGGDQPDRPSGARQTLVTLEAESSAAVDAFLARAVGLGGQVYRPAVEEIRGRYTGAVRDPDGHVWQVSWTEPSRAQTLPVA